MINGIKTTKGKSDSTNRMTEHMNEGSAGSISAFFQPTLLSAFSLASSRSPPRSVRSPKSILDDLFFLDRTLSLAYQIAWPWIGTKAARISSESWSIVNILPRLLLETIPHLLLIQDDTLWAKAFLAGIEVKKQVYLDGERRHLTLGNSCLLREPDSSPLIDTIH